MNVHYEDDHLEAEYEDRHSFEDYDYGYEEDYDYEQHQEQEKTWLDYRIDGDEESACIICSTNDNLDAGYPSEYATWVHWFHRDERTGTSALVQAQKFAGKSRVGMLGTDVSVYLNGELI